MTKNRYEVVISPLSEEDGGGYIVHVPDLFGCVADGETREEAVASIDDAIESWKLVMAEDGKEIPEPGAARAKFESRENKVDETLKAYVELVDTQKELIEQQNKALDSLRSQLLNHETSARSSITYTGSWSTMKASETPVGQTRTNNRSKAIKVAG